MHRFHGLVKGTFMLNYKTEKFNWTTTLNGNWEPNTTDYHTPPLLPDYANN